MRKHWKVLVLVLALGLLAAACGGEEGETTTTAAPETTTTEATTTTAATTTTEATTTTTAAATPLLVWADETRVPIIQGLAAEFEAATGVPVEIEQLSFDDIRATVRDQAPLGEGPDIFVGAHDWVGEFAANGTLEPIDLGARAAEFLPVALDAFSYGGSLYGLPYAVEGLGLFRNTALVPDAPATFEDLLAICDELGDTVERCLGVPAGDAYGNYYWLSSPGGYIFAYDPATGYDTTDVGLDNEGAIAGFTFFDQLVKDGYLDPAMTWDIQRDLFANGNAAFVIDGPWQTGAWKDAVAAGTLAGYAASPIPDILGNPAAPFLGVQGFMVNAFSEQKALAMTFVLDYIATEEVMSALFEAGGRPPAMLSVIAAFADDPDVVAFGEALATGNPMPNIPEMASVWTYLANAVSAIYNQTADPTTALTEAAAGVRSELGG